MSESEKPYLIEEIIIKKRNYNTDYGDNRICECGHPYHRHFDFYAFDCRDAGCKYCCCDTFVESEEKQYD